MCSVAQVALVVKATVSHSPTDVLYCLELVPFSSMIMTLLDITSYVDVTLGIVPKAYLLYVVLPIHRDLK
jgi:hypothetical protein